MQHIVLRAGIAKRHVLERDGGVRGRGLGAARARTLGRVCRISSTRAAETSARGSITATIVIIIKAMMIIDA